ncbi:MAG TPA: ABC transporter substrate-binding protein [Candidatus Acidoferrales bacterium]|nr:ABC transporter substrate-binding protein [Candidatus Acidoferrales bacterium]
MIKHDFSLTRRDFIRQVLASAAGLGAASRLGWAAAPRDRLVVAMSIGVESLHPYSQSSSPIYGLWGHIMEQLVDTDYDKRGHYGELAESWKAQGTEWTFKLRKGISFHDGSPFTAKDVAYSYERILKDPKSMQAPNLRDIVNMKVPDDHTITLVTKTPKAALLTLLRNRLILSQKAAERLGDKVDEQAIGTGPYRFAGWERGSHFTMVRNDKYWGKRAHIREVVWRPIKEDAARMAALEAGQADLINNVPPHEVPRLKNHPRIRVEVVRGMRIIFIALNPSHKPFDDKRVRQAFNYAVDQESIIKHIHEGQAFPLKGLVGPQMPGYDPNLQNYPYDPERAKKLLAEAGFPSGLALDFYAPSGRYPKDRETAQAIVSQMAKAGIKLNLKTPEWAVFEEEYNAGKYGMYMIGRGSVDDLEAFFIRYFRSGRSKRLAYNNPEFDKLFDQQSAEFDAEKREALLRKMVRILDEDCPTVPLYNTGDAYALRRDLIWTPRPDEKIPVADARFKT